MKKLALGAAIGATLMASAASAAEQRPTYLAFSAPSTAEVNTTSALVAPATPHVSKRDKFAGVPVVVPILGVVFIAAFIAAVSTGGNSSPN